jgi:hypothetical protein
MHGGNAEVRLACGDSRYGIDGRRPSDVLHIGEPFGPEEIIGNDERRSVADVRGCMGLILVVSGGGSAATGSG